LQEFSNKLKNLLSNKRLFIIKQFLIKEKKQMTREDVTGLIFYFKSAKDMDEGIAKSTVDALTDYVELLDEIAEKEAKKRKSPNKSGVVQADAATGEVIAEFATQKEALAAIGKEGKSGIGDSLNGRNRSHYAYGNLWYFKNEYPGAATALKAYNEHKRVNN
jgi:hypothetical protein